MMVLIDNYDSFSYNLYQLLGRFVPDLRVVRNDELTVGGLKGLEPDAILLSPGPGRPSDAGICVDVVKALGEKVPILGVCLGHQAICEAYGATIGYAKRLMHGKTSMAELREGHALFQGIGSPIEVGRYHSLAVVRETLPAELEVLAETADGEVMAVSHIRHPVYGLQFHPESILTPDGAKIVENFYYETQALANKNRRKRK